MGSFRNCEIIEVKDETRGGQGRDQKPPILRRKTLDDEIDKLFEALSSRRSSKSSDPSQATRNASKKPMRATGSSYTPGIGFSEPVSLKQALRGLCISQASEMAAVKRLSIPASPRTSDTGKIGSMYRSVLVEAAESAGKAGEKRMEISLVPEDVAIDDKTFESVGSAWPPKASDLSTSAGSIDEFRTVVTEEVEEKAARRRRWKARPVARTRSRSFVVKKAARLALPADRSSKAIHEAKEDEDHGSEPTICNRCHCSNNKGNVNVSQSSKSSGCDLTSSTTSLSDESNTSSFHCSNKPHMSKDLRWKAINHVIQKHGSVWLRHFCLLKKLGSGDIGTVYLAKLVGTSCKFAIKVMDNEFLGRRKKMPRAQTEREILKMLDHPFLPTLYAQFTSDNLSCLVLEYCPGGDLHVLRQQQPGRYFPEQAARFYVAEVLLALEYLHMLGIVYRDLKPENILVREDGHIMLTDFDLSLRCTVSPTLIQSSSMRFEQARFSGQCAGSSCIDPFCTGPNCRVSCFSPKLLPSKASKKHRGDPALLPQLVAEPTEARSNSFVGTHEYLAPEIIKGEGHGSSVDWWTFGIFLYELLYGRTPFKGAGNEETLTNVVLQSLKFPDTPIVSFHARDLIRSLLVKEPEGRLGTGTGAGEIKCHPFFQGMNWALVRSAAPPLVPEMGELGSSGAGNGVKAFVECGGDGEQQLEFELF